MVTKASAAIGKRLSIARSRRKMTMAQLADKASLSPSTVNLIEKSRRKPTAETVEGLARALDVDPCWLAYGTGIEPNWQANEQ